MSTSESVESRCSLPAEPSSISSSSCGGAESFTGSECERSDSSHNTSSTSSMSKESNRPVVQGGGLPRRSSKNSKPSALELWRVFDMFDEDNDGVICAKDLCRYMSRVGFEISEGEAEVLLKSVDHNDDGTIGLEEFFSVYESLCDRDDMPSSSGPSGSENEELVAAFQVFDKNQDGLISARELQMVLSDMGMAEGKSLKQCTRMIQAVDSDGNGEIDMKEFKALLSSNTFQI